MSRWKLRYAPNLGLNSTDTPLFRHLVGSLDPIDHIAFAYEQGFAGIEDNFLKLRPEADQRRIGLELERRGLEMGCFVNNVRSWNTPLWSSSDKADREALRTELEQSIDTAKRVRGRVMTTLVGRRYDVPVAFQRAAVIENLKRVASLAESANVIIGLEAVNARDYPMLLIDDVADAYAMAKAVDSPAVGIVFDIFHVQARGGDVMSRLQHCWDMIAAIQIADNPGRGEAGTGELNWPNILRLIRDFDYGGLIEFEHEIAGQGAAGERQMLDRLTAIDAAI